MAKKENKKNQEEKIDLEAQYKDIVENTEQENSKEETPKPVVPEVINQGKVNMDRFTGGAGKARDADTILGYHDVPVSVLPSKGRFYPQSTEVSIRSAKVAEIRHFSTVDEQNILDIDSKLNSILESCVRVTCKTRRLSYKDLCEEDRFYIVLSVRDLTFPEPESKLKVDHQDKKGKSHEIVIEKKYFKYFSIPQELEKYYDENERAFLIETKSFGTIKMRPPSIGIMQQMTGYIKERQEKGIEIDQSILQVMPYLSTEWRGFDKKKIFDFEMEMNTWSNKKYSLIYKIAEKLKVGIQPNMAVTLDGGEDVEIPINFRDGIKSLFIVQDIAGELL